MIVVTERHGVVAIFSRLEDGSMKQRGLFDSESLEASHLELAELATGLSTTFGWNGVDVSKAVPTKAVGRATRQALPASRPEPTPERPKRRIQSTVPPGYRSLPRGIPANAVRAGFIEEVVAYIGTHPGATATSISTGTKIHDRTVDGLLRRPEVLARLRFEQQNKTDPRRFFPPDEPVVPDD